MDESKKGTLQVLSERLAAWVDQRIGKQSPGATSVTKVVDAYLAKGVAAINDLLGRLRGKK